MYKRLMGWLSVFILALSLSGCGYNTMQSQDEAANAAWSEVLNQYQRRADLVPNLVNTVKGYAKHEQQVLTDVTNARSRVGSLNMTGSDAVDPAKMQQFSQAQGNLSSALSRLLVVSENYPDLKADQSFRDLQAQLEGTENRIALARNRYIQTVQVYNTTLRSFPNNLTAKIFGMHVRPNFVPENEAAVKQAPHVEF
ncbi:MAG: LemA family protein [Snodgrassella sp.]|uniref:LemA family protein n=1 Tax=Snodgrassella TaxID=1193515 RepID=UPI001EF428FB|nr:MULTISPECIES: LemA family protein [Snodgrassella]MCO6508077.1 LemA family protein [Snodgrassella sp.]MCO6513692.1 LemA family protein [Snodgrassella sp.]MCO6522161.1 LemA family protein [Snodgrassella sp.]